MIACSGNGDLLAITEEVYRKKNARLGDIQKKRQFSGEVALLVEKNAYI